MIQIYNMNKPLVSLTLFWRLFLSLLIMLLVTSALSVGIERWLTNKQLEQRMQMQVEKLITARQYIHDSLEKDDFKAIRKVYRQNKFLFTQMRIINEQGVVIFPKFNSHRNGYNKHNSGSIQENRRETNQEEHIHPKRPWQQVSASTEDYPELADMMVTSFKDQTYIIQLQPRLRLVEIMALRRGYSTIRVVLIVLFSLFVCYWFSRTLTRRIRRVQTAVHHISDGSYQTDNNLTELGDDELGMLAKDVARLAERLAESEMARKQMLSDISHEMRSPLARLDIATEITRDFAPEASKYLDRIESESAKMNELIGQIINLQSLQMTRYTIQSGINNDYERVNISLLLEDIKEDTCFEFQDKPVYCQWQLPTDSSLDSVVLGNQEQLYSAFENIIRNAFIHTTAHSIVILKPKLLTKTEDNVSSIGNSAIQTSAIQIDIIDSGSGIADDKDLAKIFQPFVRLSESRERLDHFSKKDSGQKGGSQRKSTTRKVSGYGLGLAIADAVIMAHNGKLTAHNRTDGKTGLVVRIVLPIEIMNN